MTLPMHFCADFETVRARWDRFWRGENRGRPHLAMVVPRANTTPVPKPPYMAGGEGQFGPVVDQVLAWAETHEFMGEALPHYVVEFGSDHFAAMLGCELSFDYTTGTSWAHPFVQDWEGLELRFRRENPWWRRTVAFIRELRRRCDGRVLIVGPSLVAGLDALAAVRGIQELLGDLVDCPEVVIRASEQVCVAYREVTEALEAELDSAQWGSMTRHGVYCSGRAHIAQCDMSCMISAEMYREFAKSCVEFECGLLDAATYHLDGPGALRHVPALLEIADLDLIQWMPGTADMEKDWTELFLSIDRGGKGHVINTVRDPDKIRWLARELKSPKTYFHYTPSCREEAEQLLADLDAQRG